MPESILDVATGSINSNPRKCSNASTMKEKKIQLYTNSVTNYFTFDNSGRTVLDYSVKKTRQEKVYIVTCRLDTVAGAHSFGVLLLGDQGPFGNTQKLERPPLVAATKQR
jgi:hypothetical protein